MSVTANYHEFSYLLYVSRLMDGSRVPPTRKEDLQSGKLFLNRNQYIENYEKGLHEHARREVQRQQEVRSTDIQEGGLLSPKVMDDNRRCYIPHTVHLHSHNPLSLAH